MRLNPSPVSLASLPWCALWCAALTMGCLIGPPGPPPPPPGACGGLEQGAAHSIHVALSPRGELLYPGFVAVSVPPPTFAPCPGGYTSPQLQDVNLTGPDGQVLPSNLEPHPTSDDFTFSFEAASAGTYTATFAYAPDAATGKPPLLYEVRVHVVRDRATDATVVTLPSVCTDLQRTSRGTWLCDAAVIREGVLIEQLEAGWLYTVQDDTVWGASKNGGSVVRWVDTGQGPLVRMASAENTFAHPDFQLLNFTVEGGSVFMRYTSWLTGMTLASEGTLEHVSHMNLGTHFPRGFARRGNRLLIARPLVDAADSESRLCTYGVVTNPDKPIGSCVQGFSAGMTEEGVWFTQPGPLPGQKDSVPLVLWLPGEEGLVKVREFHGPGTVQFNTTTHSGTPVFQYTNPDGTVSTLLPVLEDNGTTTLHAFQAQARFRGARRDFIWGEGVTPNGDSTIIYLR